MDIQELAVHAVKAQISDFDIETLQLCTPEKWDVLHSPDQLEASMKRISKCLHHARFFVDNRYSAVEQLEKAAAAIDRAMHAAFSGSAEHGSFFRQGNSGEYAPSVFMLMNDLRASIALLK